MKTVVAILVAVFLVGRYGWKPGGFGACQSADIASVEVSDTVVHMTGSYPGSFRKKEPSMLNLRKSPMNKTMKILIRRFRNGDEFAVSDVICTTLAISNRKDYSPAFIEENIRSHSPEEIAARIEDAHFYVAMDGETIIGCGGITGYWGSTEESYLTSIFVLPDCQGKGVGRKIVETLEADEYFQRAWRTEVGSSLTAVSFYRKMGYAFKNGITDADEYGVVRLEKRKEK